MRRFARILGTLMIVAGCSCCAWAFTVWRWQDPFTAVLNHFEQRELSQSLERRFDSFVAGRRARRSGHRAASDAPRAAAQRTASGSEAPSRATRSRACASRGSG